MKQHRNCTAPDPAWVLEAMADSHRFIRQGIRNGVTAMARTPGLYVNPVSEVDVLTLALRRALTAGIPLSATLGDILDEMTAMAGADDAA